MKLFHRSHDGGANSGVTGYWLIEAKSAFSIVLLHFRPGTREAFHEHAFHAITLWIKGRVREHHLDSFETKEFRAGQIKFTPRSCFHKIEALGHAWCLSIRGPWVDRWREQRGDRTVTLTYGRREIA